MILKMPRFREAFFYALGIECYSFYRFSRNLVWVILSLYDTFHAEISYSKVSFTLNQLSFVLPAVVLSCSFRDRKEPKGPGTGQNQS